MKKNEVIILIGVFAFLITLFYLNQTVFNIKAEAIQSKILGLGVIAPFVYIFLYSIRPSILFPASILSLAGGLAFGPLYGTLLTIIGAAIGAYLAFMVSRKLGSNWIERKTGQRTEKLKEIVERKGFTVVLLLRIVPLFPFDLISYAAGLSKVKTKDFMLATVIGIIPGTFAYNFLGASAFSSNVGTIVIACGLFIIITILPTMFRKKINKVLSIKDKSEGQNNA